MLQLLSLCSRAWAQHEEPLYAATRTQHSQQNLKNKINKIRALFSFPYNLASQILFSSLKFINLTSHNRKVIYPELKELAYLKQNNSLKFS